MGWKLAISIVVVIVVWLGADLLVHHVLLGNEYEKDEHAKLMRPPKQINHTAYYVAVAASALCFVGIYALLAQPRTVAKGLMYGFLFGVAVGVPMAYGTFAYMKISHMMALGWLGGSLLRCVVGGLVVGLVLKSCPKTAETA